MNFKDISGKTFGKLRVLSFSHYKVISSKQKRGIWLCLCDCGKETLVSTSYLNSGHTTSCGCYGKSHRRTHGLSKTATHRTYDGMLQRCTNINNDSFKGYGGRGILVCQRWLTSFENFVEDMGLRPKGTTLDRIDVNGGYTKDNCRWASATEQVFNNRGVSTNTSGKTGVSWASKYGKWHSYINVGGKRITNGYFEDKQLAINARKESELKYYGYYKNDGGL